MDRKLLTTILCLLACAAVTVSGQWAELLMTVYDSSTQLPTLHRVGGGDPAVWIQQKADQSNLPVAVTTLRNAQQPTAMAISYQTNDVYFVDINSGTVTLYDTIRNISYSGYSSASKNTAAMAVDWVAQNIYWVDPSFNWIRVAYFYKQFVPKTTIIYTNIDTPSGLAVIPALSYLFWSELSATVGPKIERTDLSGQNRVVLTRDVTAPVALSVDSNTNRVYWLDSGRQTLESMLWDGSDRRTFNIGLSLTSLVVYGNYVYTLGPTNALIVFDKTTGAKYKTFIDSDSMKGISIVIANSTAQPPMTSPCTTASCPQLCVGGASNTAAVCLCDELYTLPPDNSAFLCDVFATVPFYFGSELLVSMNMGTSTQYLGGWDVTTLERTTTDLFSSMMIYSSNIFYTDLDFIYTRRLVYKTVDNVIAITSATSGMNTFYTVGAGLANGNIRSISVDWLSSNIYWVDSVLNYIVVARYDLSYTLVFSQPARYPKSICVDSIGRRLFWISSVPSIGVMGLDGSNVITLVNTSLFSPQSLAFDNLHQRLYWTDSTKGTVESVNPDGSGRATFATTFIGQSMGLTVFQDFLLWTDSITQTLKWGLTTNTTGGALGSFTFNRNTPYAVLVYSGQSQPSDTAPGPCTLNNGGCSQLCLPGSGSSRTCQCVVGYTLLSDGVTCQTNVLTAPFLLLLDTCLGGIYKMNTATGDIQALQVSRQVSPVALAYDNVTSTVLWSDVQQNKIKSLPLSTGVEQTFPFTRPASASQSPAIYGMAADSAGRQLYFTDLSNKIVGRLSLDGGGVARVLVNASMSSQLGAIVLAPSDQLMFWTDSSTVTPQIVRANMDGSQVTTIISGTDVRTPTALAIDTASRTLYWADFSSGRVELATFSGSRTLIYQSPTDNYLSLTIDSNYIYLTALYSRGVTRLSRSGGVPVLFGQQQFTCLNDIQYTGTNAGNTTITMTTTTRLTSTAATTITPTTTTTARPISSTTTVTYSTTTTTTTTTTPTSPTTTTPTTTTTTPTIFTRTTATPTETIFSSTTEPPPLTTTTLVTSTTVLNNPASTTLRDTTSSTSTAKSSVDTKSPAATTTTITPHPGGGESTTPPILPTMYIIIVGVVAGALVLVALIVALTVCIVKKKKRQATAKERQNPERPLPPVPVGSPFSIYDTIGHNYAKPDSPHQHQLARDNSYVNAPEPHYIVPPKKVGQSDNPYDRLVFPKNPVTGVSNMVYDATPAPPPAYTPS